MTVTVSTPSSITAGSAFSITGSGFGAVTGQVQIRTSFAGGVSSTGITPLTWSDTLITVAALPVLLAAGPPFSTANFVNTLRVTHNNGSDFGDRSLTYSAPAGYTVVDIAPGAYVDGPHAIFRHLVEQADDYYSAALGYHQVVHATASAGAATITVGTDGTIDTTTPLVRELDLFGFRALIYGGTLEAGSANYWTSLEHKLVRKLLADDGARALNGGRVYWTLAPHSAALPFVVLTRVTAERESAMHSDTDMVHALVQMTCFAASAGAARAVADACRVALQRWRSAPIMDLMIWNETQLYEHQPDKFGHAVELMCHYRE